MQITDIRDFVEGLQITGVSMCYCGILPSKENQSIGIYPTKNNHPATIPIGGIKNRSYVTKAISILVHWNRSPTETEVAAEELWNKLRETSQYDINGHNIKFIQVQHPIPVGVDTNGVFEYVMECLFYFEKEDTYVESN